MVTIETEGTYNPGRNALAEQAVKRIRAERDDKMFQIRLTIPEKDTVKNWSFQIEAQSGLTGQKRLIFFDGGAGRIALKIIGKETCSEKRKIQKGSRRERQA